MNDAIKRLALVPFNILYKINPVVETKLMFALKNKTKLNLENPQTYLDKLNWLKLYYRNDLIPVCADKYHARAYIRDKGFEEYLPELLWEGKDPEDIPWDELPDAFVIKVTSGSGGNVICREKAQLNKSKIKKMLYKWLKRKYLPCYGEWMYGILEPRIIIEEFLTDKANYVPMDYKMFCFNNLNGGDVGCIAVDLGRYIAHKRNMYDNEWNFLPDVSFDFETAPEANIPKPAQYEQMRQIAKTLAEPFPHVRVDFFVIGDRFYIGELTFFNGAGFDMITPHAYNVQLGEWIALPNDKAKT